MTKDDLDTSLIQATLQGSQQSFNQLILKHQPSLLLMVHRHLRQREEAEDVVQQVFIRAYQHLPNFRGEAKFSTWLFTIALNLIRNHVRQRKMRRMDSLDDLGGNEEKPAPQWRDGAPSTEDIAQHRWDLEKVRDALEKVMEPHRTIFTLHYFQHLSIQEAAARVGRPPGTAKVYLQRAREMVLKNLVTSQPAAVSDAL